MEHFYSDRRQHEPHCLTSMNICKTAINRCEGLLLMNLKNDTTFAQRTECCFKQNPRGDQICFDIQRGVTNGHPTRTDFYVCEINTDLTHPFQVSKSIFIRELCQCCSQAFHQYQSADVGVFAKQPHLDTAFRAKRFYHFCMLLLRRTSALALLKPLLSACAQVYISRKKEKRVGSVFIWYTQCNQAYRVISVAITRNYTE